MTIAELMIRVLLSIALAGGIATCGMLIPASPVYVAPLYVGLAALIGILVMQVWS